MLHTHSLTALGAAGALAAVMSLTMTVTAAPPEPDLTLVPLGTYRSGIFDNSGAEIVAHDPGSQRLFVVNFAEQRIDVVSIVDPANPTLIGTIDVDGSPNSVDIHDGLVAVAVEASPKTNPGHVAFLDVDGNELKRVTVGALPDMLTFTPDGSKVVVANEGEPGAGFEGDAPAYASGLDPEGTVSIIDLSAGVDNATVATAAFTAFNGDRAALVSAGVRIHPDAATVAQDLEPEFVTVSSDSSTAWVALQENNAIAEVDLASATVTRILPLGRKDHSLPGRGIDPSDRDPEGSPTFNIRTYDNLFGIHMPDGLASIEVAGVTYLITANEGDAREYTGLTDVSRVRDLRDIVEERTGVRPSRANALCADAFPDRDALILENELGRLNVSTIDGYDAENGCFHELHALGGRSFSIFTTDGTLVFDSAEDFERITQARYPASFNSNHTENNLEGRSDDKGPEPEGITVATLFGRTYVLVGLERIGGVITYDVTDPTSPVFVNYTNNRDFAQSPWLDAGEDAVSNPAAGDLGIEGLIVVQGDDSPNGRALVVTANEVSGTTTVFEVVRGKPVPPPCSSVGRGNGKAPFGPPPVCDRPFPPGRR